MRPFELLIFLSNMFYLVLSLVPGTRSTRWVAGLPLLAVLFLLVHLLVEHSRWQMWPLYGLTAILLVVALVTWMGRAHLAAGWAFTLLALVVIAALPALLFPVPSLPKPGGPFAIGTSVFEWVDESREEIYPQPEGKPRRMMVQVWYPAAAQLGCSPEPYLRDIQRLYPALSQALNWPGFAFSHLRLAKTNACTDAPAPTGTETYPVLVFSHGWTGFRTQNTFQMEELASHGYVVFSADHTYGAAGVIFPNGDLAFNYDQALPSNVPEAEYDQAARKLGLTFVNDIRYVLDQAGRMQSGEIPSVLTGRLDLARVGILGHSTGAGAAVETCWVDPRCKAGLAMDPWLIPYSREMVEQGVNQPMMWMHSASWVARRNPPLVNTLFSHLHGDAYRLYLNGSNHYTFSDTDGFMPLIARLRAGQWGGPSQQVIINDYTLAFFDQYLKGQPSTLLNPSTPDLPGVRLEQKGE